MSVDERLNSLERANRTLRWSIAVLVLAFVGFRFWHDNTLPAAPAVGGVTKVLNVERLNIVGPDGNVEAFWTAGKGDSFLSMGKGFWLSSYPKGNTNSGMMSLDNGVQVLHLSTFGLSLGQRTAAAAKQRERYLQRIESGETDIPANEVKAATLPPDNTIELALIETGGGELAIKNQFGKKVVSAQSNKANIGAVYLYDVSGKLKNYVGAE